jgi:hypothetical protein
MALRDTLAKKIQQKKQEIEGLENQVREARAYLSALEDTFRMLPRDLGTLVNGGSQPGPRASGQVAKAQATLAAHGKPMHIADLLDMMGKPVTRVAKQSLASQLSAYSKKGEIFTALGRNTFGLIEFGVGASQGPGLLDPPD